MERGDQKVPDSDQQWFLLEATQTTEVTKIGTWYIYIYEDTGSASE